MTLGAAFPASTGNSRIAQQVTNIMSDTLSQTDGACYPEHRYDIRQMRFATHSITKLRG